MTDSARRHFSRVHVSALAACAASILLGVSSASAQTAVTLCGQVVSGDGFLSADLDCTGFPGTAVTLISKRGSLDLAGFTLTSGAFHGVECTADCTVLSSVPGGTIQGTQPAGTASSGVSSEQSNIAVRGVTITGHEIGADNARAVKALKFIDSVATGNHRNGLNSQKITCENSTISLTAGSPGSGGPGISGGKVKMTNCNVTDNFETGVSGSKIICRDSVVENNDGDGVRTMKVVRAKNCQFLNNGLTGVGGPDTDLTSTPTGKIILIDSESSNNGAYGVTGAKAKLKNSTVTGNGDIGVRNGSSTGLIKDSVITGNESGASFIGGKAKIVGSTITGNAFYGAIASEVAFNGRRSVISTRDTIITGNGTDPSCGAGTLCADIIALVQPQFTYVPAVNDCTHSLRTGATEPWQTWGICELDCGNGTINAGEGEECDDSGESAACDIDCTIAFCGDGRVNRTRGETCDDGGTVSNDGCDASCNREFCGDGITQTGIGETCDDSGESATCDANCTVATCGDNTHNATAGEDCDGSDDDACPGQCTVGCTCP